jgi:hypothetical protein
MSGCVVTIPGNWTSQKVQARKQQRLVSGHRVDQHDVRARPSANLIRDRDQRAASDTRSLAQRWCGDPPPGRSALDQRTASHDPSGALGRIGDQAAGVKPVSPL